ncbi:carotenoid biosynthesis protein [Paenibacillus sp. IB182496]|uniref:Carotenoid biosynthesis protein n=1 Tax=Paenibacillus sabuli TaxID=2772509 RepID=A0A927BWM6_9BACL|nr:carotenoid biosynthesis protein [Paenibacillus sabuli]MBD2848231.1 carotenoid biosynthesis protein [Paenibacillus sabuli]
MRRVFYFWYAVGLILMLTVGVPSWLGFANGLFLLFFALYTLNVEGRLGEPRHARWPRAALIGLATFLVEWLGVRTGWPFGEYAYTPLLGWGVGGVPLTIACAWVGVVLLAALVSESGSRWLRALLTGVWTVVFDLVLDPVAFAREFWIWGDGHGGGYFGVPIVNFVSWFVLSASLSLLLPVRMMTLAVRREAVRLLQLMLLMFGLLGAKEGLYIPLAVALIGMLAAEGVLRYVPPRQPKPAV